MKLKDLRNGQQFRQIVEGTYGTIYEVVCGDISSGTRLVRSLTTGNEYNHGIGSDVELLDNEHNRQLMERVKEIEAKAKEDDLYLTPEEWARLRQRAFENDKAIIEAQEQDLDCGEIIPYVPITPEYLARAIDSCPMEYIEWLKRLIAKREAKNAAKRK